MNKAAIFKTIQILHIFRKAILNITVTEFLIFQSFLFPPVFYFNTNQVDEVFS